MEAKETVASFFTTHAALRAEKLLIAKNIAARLIPTPRYLSADCTIALVFASSDQPRVQAILEGHGIEAKGFYELR